MTDLQPHRDRPVALLTGGARFIRGFTRIGTVVALLVVLIGIPGSIIVGLGKYNDAVDTRERAQCIARLAREGWTFKKKYEHGIDLDYDVGGCSGGFLTSQSIK